jgi:subtilisin family serine protease
VKTRLFLAQTFLAVSLATLCGEFGVPFAPGVLGMSISQALADDDSDDSSSSTSSNTGSTAGSQDGSNSDRRNAVPFTLFGPGDREPNELLATGLSRSQLTSLRQLGYTVVRERNSRLLSSEVLRLKIPPSMRLDTALAQVRNLAPKALVDFNHLFRPTSCSGTGNQCPAQVRQQVGWGTAAACNVRTRVGLIDTTVDTAHPALIGQSIQVLRVRSQDREASSAAHGTAVASLLVGRADSGSPGLLPRAQLVAADAFHSRGRSGDRLDAFDFVAALDALTAQGVSVINLSFAGPANTIIERSIARAHQRGSVLVAAVGNDGPNAAPLFPAAYAQVIAVTAVRSDGTVFRRAVRGQHVALAAPGVDVWTAQTANARKTDLAGPQTGTSMAAPFVTAAASVIHANGAGKNGPSAVRQALLKLSKDLGEPGIDTVYGHGLLQMESHCGGLIAKLP